MNIPMKIIRVFVSVLAISVSATTLGDKCLSSAYYKKLLSNFSNDRQNMLNSIKSAEKRIQDNQVEIKDVSDDSAKQDLEGIIKDDEAAIKDMKDAINQIDTDVNNLKKQQANCKP